MTTTDPTPAQHEMQTSDMVPSSNYLDYAAEQYARLAEQPPPMPTDVLIAALIGVGDETRANAAAIGRLTIAVERLEALIADPTAVLRARQAEEAAHRQGDLFGQEESEVAVRAVEDTAVQQKAAGG